MDLSAEFQRFHVPREKKSYEGLDAWVHSFFRLIHRLRKSPRVFRKKAEAIHQISLQHAHLSPEELQEKIRSARKIFRGNPNPEEQNLADSLALVAEASFRSLGMRPYPVQLMGVLAQFDGYLIEMKPGEGKTIVAGITAVLAGWSGLPCHVVTSNDYLASRDAELMQPLFSLCQLRGASVTGSMSPRERKEAYSRDIVYTTSKELLADFLRDRMGQEDLDWDRSLIRNLQGRPPKPMVMRGLHTAIIDEADSVLADEATTPLIISIPSENELLKEASQIACEIARKMRPDKHYTVNRKFQDIRLTPAGESFVDELVRPLPAMWKAKERRQFLVHQALAAREFYHLNQQYLIDEEGKVVIVDEATGRIMEHRNWGSGLHQAIEAKEELELSDPTETHTRMSFQRYFRLYKRLSGMSGTLQNLQEELWQIYRLPTMKIPKRIPRTYEFEPVTVCATLDEKWSFILKHIREVHRKNQPVLVGTRSVEESEWLANELAASDLSCTILNALKHEEEAQIVAKAGELGGITIATNMAGRGTDIHVDREVEELGGLHVVATQKYESCRIDLQLYGRTSRQGQPGSVKLVLSLEDDLFRKHCPQFLQNFLHRSCKTPWGNRLSRLIMHLIQRRIESRTSSIRLRVLNRDFSLNEMMSFSLR